jgi:hypothetical protein
VSGKVSARIENRARQLFHEGWPIGPLPMPCVCGAPRHAHSGPNRTGRHADTGCYRYRHDPADALALRAAKAASTGLVEAFRRYSAETMPRPEVRDGQFKVGPSDYGRCPRSIWYRENPPDGFRPLPEDKRAAEVGSMIHDAALAARRHLYPWRHIEQPVVVPGLDRPGRPDDYDPITGILDDVKTAGRWKWDMVGQDGPPDEWWGQVHIYGLAKQAQGHHVTHVRITVINRENGREEPFMRPFDEAYAKRCLDWLLGVLTRLDLGEELERNRPGPSTDPLCQRCFARVHCWNLDEAKELGRSGESLTLLGRHPAEAEIEKVGLEYVQARDERLAAHKVEKELAAVVDGIPLGTYGEVVATEKRNGTYEDNKALVEQIRAWAALPERMRGPMPPLEAPVREKARSIVWKRRRASTRQNKGEEST